MVQVRRAPVILISVSRSGVFWLGVVVQKTRLGGVGRANDMFEVALRISLDFLLSEAVAGLGDEDGDVDDEAAEARHGRLKPGEGRLGRPDVGREILREGLGGEVRGWSGALQGRVDVEGAVGVVAALEGVDLAVLEGFLAEGPACEVLGLWVFQLLWGVVSKMVWRVRELGAVPSSSLGRLPRYEE